MKLRLTYIPQVDDVSCAPAAVGMLLEHLGMPLPQPKLKEKLHTSYRGTTQESIVSLFRTVGFDCQVRENGTIEDIICCLQSGYPPLVNYTNPLSGHGHYAVVTGFDEQTATIILADPRNGNDYSLSFDAFRAAWHSGSGAIRGWFIIVGREGITPGHCEV